MKTPSQILWAEAGEPAPSHEPSAMDGPCCVCGAPCRIGFDRNDGWSIPKNDTSQEMFRAQSSPMVCAACVWVSKGRWKDQFRLWSPCHDASGGLPDHYEGVYDQWGEGVSYDVRLQPLVEGADDRVYVGCRGSLWPHARLMLNPPAGRWFAVVSESAQKNLIRHGQTNRGAGRWRVQFEMTEVKGRPAPFALMMWHVCWLRLLGVSKEAIARAEPDRYHIDQAWSSPDDLPVFASLDPLQKSILSSQGAACAELIQQLCHGLKPVAGSRKLELALYLEHEDYRDDLIDLCRRELEGGGGRSGQLDARLHPAGSIRLQTPTESLGLGAQRAQ